MWLPCTGTLLVLCFRVEIILCLDGQFPYLGARNAVEAAVEAGMWQGFCATVDPLPSLAFDLCFALKNIHCKHPFMDKVKSQSGRYG